MPIDDEPLLQNQEGGPQVRRHNYLGNYAWDYSLDVVQYGILYGGYYSLVLLTGALLGYLLQFCLNSTACREYASVDSFGDYKQMSQYELRGESLTKFTLYDPNGDTVYNFTGPDDISYPTRDVEDDTNSDELRSSVPSIGHLHREWYPWGGANYTMTFNHPYRGVESINLDMFVGKDKYVLAINGVEFIGRRLKSGFTRRPGLSFAQRKSSSGVNSSSVVPTHLGVAVETFTWWSVVYRICLPSTDDPALDRTRLLALSIAALGRYDHGIHKVDTKDYDYYSSRPIYISAK